MGKSYGRVGDIGVGVCYAHKSPKAVVVILVTGVPNAHCNGRAQAIRTSIGVSSCGHAAIAVTGSNTVRCSGFGVHRQGDIGILPGGVYVLATGSGNSHAG